MSEVDSYAREPTRRHDMTVNAPQPYNAEPPVEIIRSHYVTPTDYFYVRNHAPVPDINPHKYKFVVDGMVAKPREVSLHELKAKYTHHTVMCTLMCAGNRRTEMSNLKTVKGVGWGNAALSNAIWKGVRLCDVLEDVGAEMDNPHLHVDFYGGDPCVEENYKKGYGSSIPMSKAADPQGDVILAFEMNGEPLPRDHGFPVRVIVPGYIGARSVKWLKSITVKSDESESFFQRRDYKVFLPSVNWDNVNDWWDRTPSLAGLSVQAAITNPKLSEAIATGSSYTVSGYALSGGNRIVRVDISLDGGKSWQTARIFPGEEKGHDNRYWAWAFWDFHVDQFPSPCEIVCKALDIGNNGMPDDLAQIWNLRGVMNNSWHHVSVPAKSKY
ncbi:PREDICTED: sulfite oxidase, mitochondrial-like [Priapulus caudatus]|uniref:Sulfite oxidase, mitochondrial-like n=1 Tax=Priapulus caudatus TaxID=37621 RepID=A0ABM1FAF1_PRICU|nr:PREDICTED: sulfite oxidase, mitochondrial-like [Priapulus caudatus]XP_014681422.1 PREDICTED: sulfite oxidase, mitochondrial-like [Priapulus caudatus]XP_014681429.1 PREDICTED: sulfite oxidase, mitochondrial-like [Priapulus caudatus]